MKRSRQARENGTTISTTQEGHEHKLQTCVPRISFRLLVTVPLNRCALLFFLGYALGMAVEAFDGMNVVRAFS